MQLHQVLMKNPLLQYTLIIDKENLIDVEIDQNIHNLLKDSEETVNSRSADGREKKNNKKEKKSVKGLGTGLLEKNKKEQSKKINNKQKNILLNIFNIFSGCGLIFYFLINQKVWPRISEILIKEELNPFYNNF